MKILLSAALAIGLSAAAITPSQAVVIGTANGDSNSIPFDTYLGGYYFQQVYSGLGSTNINSLTFYNTKNPGGTPATGSFQLYLSYISSSTNIAAFDNQGQNFAFPDGTFTQVYSGTLPALTNGKLDFALSTAFNYNPADGYLLLTVRNFDLSGDGNLFLDSVKNSSQTNSRFSAYMSDSNTGLVTGFNEQVAAVPEPSTWAMMILGFAGVGFLAYRRRKGAMLAA